MENKKEIIITRVFDAPREMVWKAWTNPSMVKKWWGPAGFTAPVAKIDLKTGGSYLYCMRGSAAPGEEVRDFWSGGKFVEVNAPESLTLTDHFSNERGEVVDPASYGMNPDFPKESTVKVKFEEIEKDKTKLSIIYSPESETERVAMEKSGMQEGWGSSLDKLAEILI